MEIRLASNTPIRTRISRGAAGVIVPGSGKLMLQEISSHEKFEN
jgi:ribosomal protein S3